MESAEQPAKNLHAGVKEPLKQLGHTGSTVPPQDTPVLTEEARKWIEEKTRDAVHIADVSIINTGESNKIRIAGEKPTSIFNKRLNQAREVLKKAA